MTDADTRLGLIGVVETAVLAAVTAQRDTPDPSHEEFYAWGGALTDTLRRFEYLCAVLDRQVGNYGNRRVLRDDDGINPYGRLAEMRELLKQLSADLRAAGATADRYWSASLHIVAEVDPQADID